VAAFKDHFDAAAVGRIADAVRAVDVAGGFDAVRFTQRATDGLEDLALKGRITHVARALVAAAPRDAATTVGLLADALDRGASGLGDWERWPVVEAVGLAGYADPQAGLAGLARATRHASAEFAIRPYLDGHPELTLAALREWERDPDPAVRRLVSEGTRPRLPWGPRLRGPLGADPALVLGHLRALRADPDEVVRRSVANHLGDLLKVDRELALGLAREWADDPRDEVRRVVRHGVRAALKAGDPDAFALVGAAVAPGALDVSPVEVLTPEVIVPGGALRFRARIRNVTADPLELLLHYVLREPRARGEGERVVALSSRRLAPGAAVDVERTHVYRPTTIRTDRPGAAAVALQCSGLRGPFSDFRLVAADDPGGGGAGSVI
jgi:3-methyladenine DNA glycosylase AlkC